MSKNRLVPFVLFFLLAAAPARAENEGPAGAAPVADYSLDAIRARFAELRPKIEEALGSPFENAPEFVLANQEEMLAILEAEAAKHQAEMEQSPLLDAAGTAQLTRGMAGLLAGKLELSTGRLHIQPDAFRRMADAHESFALARTQAFLDSVLVHEAVHAWQRENFDLEAFVGRPKTFEVLQCRMCVIEGHAQHVTRKVARELGFEEACDLLVRLNAAGPPGVEDPLLRAVGDTMAAVMGTPYTRGEPFVAAVLGELGDGPGLRRLFAAPPTTLRQVLRPAEYLNPESGGPDLRETLAAVRKTLDEDELGIQTMGAAEPALRAGTAPFAEPDAVDRAFAGFLEGQILVGGVKGAPPGTELRTVALLAFDSIESAQEFLRFEEAVSRRKDETFSEAGGPVRILEPVYEELADRGLAGIWIRKQLEVAMAGTLHSGTLVVREGTVVAEITSVSRLPVEKAFLLSLGRIVRDSLRGEEPAPPATRTGGADHPVIFAPSAVDAPAALVGVVSFDGARVVVELHIDGEKVAVDEEMEEGENAFEFQVPESYRGRTVELVAIGPGGKTTKAPVRVD